MSEIQFNFLNHILLLLLLLLLLSGLQKRVRIGKLFSLFLIQNVCCRYSKETSQ